MSDYRDKYIETQPNQPLPWQASTLGSFLDERMSENTNRHDWHDSDCDVDAISMCSTQLLEGSFQLMPMMQSGISSWHILVLPHICLMLQYMYVGLTEVGHRHCIADVEEENGKMKFPAKTFCCSRR